MFDSLATQYYTSDNEFPELPHCDDLREPDFMHIRSDRLDIDCVYWTPLSTKYEQLNHTDNTVPPLFSVTGRVVEDRSQLEPTGCSVLPGPRNMLYAHNSLCIGLSGIPPFDYNLGESIARIRAVEELLTNRWTPRGDAPDYTSYQTLSAIPLSTSNSPNVVVFDFDILRKVMLC